MGPEDKIGQSISGETPGDIKVEENGGQKPEKEVNKELTLEEQTQVYSEILGIDQAEIMEKAQTVLSKMTEEERQDMTMLFYVPEGKFSDIWDIAKTQDSSYEYVFMEYNKDKIIGETEKGLVGFSYYGQEPDKDTLDEGAKSALGWEKTDNSYMTLKARIIAGIYYLKAHGQHLDEKSWTMCPHSRFSGGAVPVVHTKMGEVLVSDKPGSLIARVGPLSGGEKFKNVPDGSTKYDGTVVVSNCNPGAGGGPDTGVRRVVTEEF